MLKFLFSFVLFFTSLVFAESAKIPFEFVDNRIFVEININGAGPFVMMLDTGASNILDTESAKRLNLTTYDSFKIEGGGEYSVLASWADVQNINLAGLNFFNQRFMVVDLSGMKKAIGFKKFDGLIGYEVFSKYVAEVNFEQKEVMFTSPFQFNKKPTGTIIPFIGFDGGTPLVEASIDGLRGKFWLDTGDRAAMTLTTPFIQAHNLKEFYKPDFEVITGWGIAGPLNTQIVRAKQVTLGSETFFHPILRLPTATKGGMTSTSANGTIGNELLRRFNLTINYSKNHIVLNRNSNYDQPHEFDRSGMWLMLDGTNFKVLDVFKNSPADQAGIRIGDIITAVDQKPTVTLFLPELRLHLAKATTKSVTVSTESGDLVITLNQIIKSQNHSLP